LTMAAAMEQPLQPDLVKSGTDDDDNSSVGGAQEKAMEYLLRYETMVRQQDAEDMATLAHLRPLLYRIEKLGGKESKDTPLDMEDIMSREVSFCQLQRALKELDNDSSHVMTTDRQLMLVLRTLARKSPETDDECISWAEFYQCYKTVVTGMQTLQYVPSQSLVRSRTKDRTLTILSMFEPPSTKLFNEDIPRSIHTGEEALEDDRRRHAIPEARPTRRKAVLYPLFAVIVALLGFLFVQTPYMDNAKQPILVQMNDVVSKATTFWSPEAQVIESPRLAPQQQESFFNHHFYTLEERDPSTLQPAGNQPAVVTRNKKDNANVAVLAGAGGVAIAPLLLKIATFLGTGGLPGMGAVTVFTVALAPIIKVVDVLMERFMRKLQGRKQ